MTLAGEIVAAIAADPDALAALRGLVTPREAPSPTIRVYTVATLAAETGRSQRSIRGAIHRGELEAVKRGKGWVISGAAAERWATAPAGGGSSSSRSRRSSRRSSPGAMARALKR